MLKIILHYVVPFLIPFAAFFLFALLTKRVDWRKGPYFWLTTAGLGLTLISLVIFSFGSGDDPSGTYVPPKIVDGKIVPSHVDPAPVAAPDSAPAEQK